MHCRTTCLAAALFLSLSPITSAQPPAPPAPPLVPDPAWRPRPGDIASVYSIRGLDVPATYTLLAMEDLVKAGKANDSAGIRELMADERLVLLANLTKVRVIDVNDNPHAAKGMILLEVRVEDGDHRDRKVWIPRVEVARLVPKVERVSPAEMVPGSSLPRGKVRPVPRRLPDRPVDPATRAASSLQMGKNVRFQGNRPGAVQYFRRAIKEAPESPAAREAGRLLREMGATP